ncbi:MAG TPA: gliding motility-associated C-terminal domain-containing protein, partial [Chitinophagales bacterium]|nr:gliding motility-associated C-terminal domain-containing protein [Chitinophagales bacterium]
AISIQYNSGFGGANEGYHPNQVYDCWTIQDTIEIPPYRRPEIVNTIKITCHGNSFIELRADSVSGVPPYTYEIIGGPQTAPAQINPEFSLSLVGTYLARITDACGTANTTNFTIDTAAFPPINKFGSSCTGGTTRLTYQSSPHIVYRWKKPNGSVYTGDTLLINPTTTADTGVYEVTKTVTINGCVDSFTAYYNLQQNAMHYVYDTICHGSSVIVGNHTYSSSGTYRDTLATSGGCDSIVVLNLHVAYRRDSTLHTLCAGESITISGISYSSNASFDDTITGGGCDSIHTVVISVKDYLRGSRLETICSGGQYSWNGRNYTTTGIYRDTLATAGCDSVAVLYLSVLPIPHENMSATICEGETYLWGGNYYYEAGVYRDSVPSQPCYKTRELTLHVAAKPQGSTETQKYSVEFTDSVTLSACITDSAYHWNYGACAGCSTITVKPKDEYNYYQCTITNGDGCSAVCNYEVYVEGIYGNVFVPNVFTPNGDGANDVFRIYGENIRFHSMQVFNRWGEKIYDNENENNGWDGTYKGALQPPGVYVYMVKYSPLYTAESRNIKGSVTLLK